MNKRQSTSTSDHQQPGPSSQSDPVLFPVAGPSRIINEKKLKKRIAACKNEYIDFLYKIGVRNPPKETSKENFKQCSTSPELDFSDDSMSSSSVVLSARKKRKKWKGYKYLPSEDSYLLSDEECDEDRRKKTRICRSTFRDILAPGYEKIRKTLGKPNYDSIGPVELETSELQEDSKEDKKKYPRFDENGLGILDYDAEDDFTKFVLNELPLIPDDEESFENNEAIKKWLDSVDLPGNLPEEPKFDIHSNNVRFEILSRSHSEFMASETNYGIAVNRRPISAAKSKVQKSKQTAKKKTLKGPAKHSVPKAVTRNKKAQKSLRDSPKRSYVLSKGQKSKTTRKIPKKLSSPRLKPSHPVCKSVKSPSKKVKKRCESKYTKKPTSSYPQKVKPDLKKRKTVKLAEKDVELKSDNFKKQTSLKSPAAKRDRKRLAKKITSKQPESIVKNPTFLEYSVAKKERKGSASKFASRRSKNNSEFCYKSSRKDYKSFKGSSSPIKKKEISSKIGTVVRQKKNKGLLKVAKLNRSVGSKSFKKSVPVAEQKNQLKSAALPKSFIGKSNLGQDKSSLSLCKTKLITQVVKRKGLRSQTSFCSKKELKSSTSEKQTIFGKSSLKQGSKQCKVGKSVHLQSKETKKSAAKLPYDPMLGAKKKAE